MCIDLVYLTLDAGSDYSFCACNCISGYGVVIGTWKDKLFSCKLTFIFKLFKQEGLAINRNTEG